MPINKPVPIAVDFDGTCVTHEFPDIGRDIGAIPVLKDLVRHGAQLILWTMRSGESLDAAIKWFNDNEIPLFGIQSNPTQSTWTSSPKVYAKIYIDDAALGAPLIYPEGQRPFVDWKSVRQMLLPNNTRNF